MSNHRARAFVPALFVQLFITLTISQHAFSQETQTTTQPAQPAVVATAEKVAAKEEACEQSPAATALTPPPSIAQTGAVKATVPASQPLSFPSTRTVTTVAARPLLFEAAARNASKSFDASTFSTQDTSGGAQQTSASSYTPLTSEEKMRRGFKNAFLSPQAYALPFVSAVITEWGEDDLPHKDTDDRVADGLSRFAIKFGRRATNNLLGGVYSSVFRQDPRYERVEGKGVGARIVHAASRVFITRGDNGKHQPNYTRFASQLSSSALSNLWEQSTPGHDRIGTDATFRRFGNSFITGAIFNVFNEFLPDIKKIFGR
ncbi:MAG: hypothetical protein LC803_08700 [Acidobacteria bacterium]|nr:hypothetical protein [Acidobacteriota bacterium]